MTNWAIHYRIYLPHVYDPYLWGHRNPYSEVTWYLPDGIEMNFPRISPGTGYGDAVFEFTGAPQIFTGSRIDWNGNGWDLSLEDGTTYLSPEAYYSKRPQQGSLVGIFDRNGNEVRLSRQSNGDLTEIKSPNGLWIRLTYDDEGRILNIKDSFGNVVNYGYDSDYRLSSVRYPTGQTINYSFDSWSRIVKIDDSSRGILIENKYDSKGRVIEQNSSNGRIYKFRYVDNEPANSRQVDVTDLSGKLTRVMIRQIARDIFYTFEEPARVPTHH